MKYRHAGKNTQALTRRSVMVGTAAAISAAAIGRSGQAFAAEKLAMRLDWSTHGCHAPIFLAIQKGWTKAADIDLSVEEGNGSTTTVQLIGSGQFDLGHAALAPMAIGTAKGLPVISIAGFIRKGDTGVLVPKDKNWTQPSDLIGKKCVYTAGSLEGPFVRPFFEKNKVPVDKVALLNVEASAKVGTYLSGNADAAISTVPFFLPITAGKRDSTGILFADFGLDLPGFGLIAHRDKLKAKGDAIKRLASVVAAAWVYILAGHEQEAADAIRAQRPDSPLPAKIFKDQIEAYRSYFHTAATTNTPIGLQSDVDWQKTIGDMEVADTIPKGTKPSNYFTNDFIDHAFGKKVIGA
jgi:NitT/TauT family transport system substrate-binding protein